MAKGKIHPAIIVAIILVIIGVVVTVILLTQKSKTTPPGSAPGGSGGSSGGNVTVPASEFPLGYGSKGQYVRNVQTALNGVIDKLNSTGNNVSNVSKLTVDGNWGGKTQYAFETLSAQVGIPLTNIATQTQYTNLITAANAFAGTTGGGSSWTDFWQQFF